MKIPVCFIIAGFTFMFGMQNHSLLKGLIMLVVFDAVMGLASSYVNGVQIESRRAFKGGAKLFVYAILVSAGYFTENIIPGNTLLDVGMISFLALTEFISIMENAGRMGFVVPQKILNQVISLRDGKADKI